MSGTAEFSIITVEARVEVVVRETRGRTTREWVEERASVWNEVECPEWAEERRLELQVRSTVKRTVGELSTNLRKWADET